MMSSLIGQGTKLNTRADRSQKNQLSKVQQNFLQIWSILVQHQCRQTKDDVKSEALLPKPSSARRGPDRFSRPTAPTAERETVYLLRCPVYRGIFVSSP